MFNFVKECKPLMKKHCAKYNAKCGFDSSNRLGCYRPTGFLGLGRTYLDTNAYRCERNKSILSNVRKKAAKCDVTRSVGSGTCGKKEGFYNNQSRPCTDNGDCDKGDTCKIPHQCDDNKFCAQVDSYTGICLTKSQLARQTKCNNVKKEQSTFTDNGRQMYWFTSKNYYCASNDPYC